MTILYAGGRVDLKPTLARSTKSKTAATEISVYKSYLYIVPFVNLDQADVVVFDLHFRWITFVFFFCI